MVRVFPLSVLAAVLMMSLPMADLWGRGRGGGGGRSMGGGGFSGGRGGGNFGGGGFSGARGGGNFGGGGFSGGHGGGFSGGRGGGNLGGGGFSGGRGGGNFGGGGFSNRPSPGRGNVGAAGRSGVGSPASPRLGSNAVGGGRAGGGVGELGNRAGAERGNLSGNNFSRPSSDQLGNFLGMPSDGGMHSLAAGSRNQPSQLPAGEGRFDVNKGTASGDRGQAAGVAVTGPRGNTAGRAVGVGADGGVAAVGGAKGADGGAAVRGAAVGPGGQAVAGRAAVGPNGYAGGGVVARGPGGVAAGFTRISPSGRYTTAAAVRTNYNHWDVYGAGWHTAHPGAWYAAGWATGAAWRAATWNSVGAWLSYPVTAPVYYDYGNTVTSDGESVYVDGQSAGTTQEYYQQASDLASAGASADAPADGEWLPLGVFALTKEDHDKSVVSLELAVNKQGVIRGNYTDTETGKTQLIKGSVDKETQRVVFSVGDNSENFIETGLYNLTKDEAPALIHVGKEKTEQWLLVRLEQPDSPSSSEPVTN